MSNKDRKEASARIQASIMQEIDQGIFRQMEILIADQIEAMKREGKIAVFDEVEL